MPGTLGVDQPLSLSQVPYRIEKDNSVTFMTSESAEIFINSVSIQNIMSTRYNGAVHVFVVEEQTLAAHMDQEIIDNKLYKFVKTVHVEDMTGDTLTLEYF